MTSTKNTNRYKYIVAINLVVIVLILLALFLPSITIPAIVSPKVMLVMDVSTSMDIKDFEPSRMHVAKDCAILFLFDQMKRSDAVGLVAFCGSVQINQSLTTNKEKIKQMIKDLKTCSATAIGEGIKSAALNFGDVKDRKVIILITGGANNAGIDPLTAVEDYVKGKEIKIYTIGIGTEEEGEFDEDILKTIALRTGGEYYYAPTPEELRNIYSKISAEIYKVNLFRFYLYAAILLLLINIFLLRKGKSERQIRGGENE